MDPEVRWSAPAAADLEAIAEYIAKDSEQYAGAFVDRILDAVEQLGALADRGQIVPEFQDASLREILVAPYRIVYELTPGTVMVVALIHGARRLNREGNLVPAVVLIPRARCLGEQGTQRRVENTVLVRPRCTYAANG